MKILHVLNHSVPHTDGYCIRSANIVQSQREIGLEPVVVTSPHHEPAPTELVEEYDGVRYHRILNYRRATLPVWREMKAVRCLRRKIEEVIGQEKPDVIHAHSPCLWGHAAHQASRRFDLPLVYEVRGIWEDASVDEGRITEQSLKYRLSRRLETSVLQRADAVVTISQGLVREILARVTVQDKVFLVPNGVNVEAFPDQPVDSQLRDSLGLDGYVTLGYVGSLYAWEGVDDLIRAVPQMVQKVPTIRLLIVGGGQQEARLRELVDQLGLGSNVIMVGRVPHADVQRYYSVIDVLVYPRKPSRQMDMVTPLKPLEAMAMGKTVLGSDVGGIGELVTEGSGLLFRAGDVDDLAQKAVDLISDEQLRRKLGKNAAQHVAATRSWKKLIGTYRDVYEYVKKPQPI